MSKLGHVDHTKCALPTCGHRGETFLSLGGYRYCSVEHEQADAAAQAETF